MNLKGLTGIVYTRVSSTGQDENLSEQGQFTRTAEFLEGQGVKLYKGRGLDGHLHDSYTGTAYAERRAIQQALELVSRGLVRVIAFYEVDRAARDFGVFQQLLHHVYVAGGLVGVASKRRVYPDYDEAFEDLFLEGVMAAREGHNIRKRTNRGKLDAFKAGGWLRSIEFGYRLEATVKGRVKMPVIDEEQAALVCSSISLYLAGGSFYDMAEAANRKEPFIPPITGESWPVDSMKRIVDRAMKYAGEPFTIGLTINGEKHTATRRFPPIIPVETAMRVMEQRQVRRSTNRRAKKHAAVAFSGLVWCSNCGARATIRPRGRAFSHSFSVCCTSYARRLTYASSGRPTDFPVCGGTLGHRYIAAAVMKYLKRFSRNYFRSEFRQDLSDALGNFTALYTLGTALGSKVEQLKAEQAEIGRRYIIAETASPLLARQLEGELERLQDELQAAHERLEETQGKLDTYRHVFGRLGLEPILTSNVAMPIKNHRDNWNEADLNMVVSDSNGRTSLTVPIAAINALEARLEELRTLLKASGYDGFENKPVKPTDWGRVNELMSQLGLKVWVNFGEPDEDKRRKSPTVQLDHTILGRAMGTSGGYQINQDVKAGR